jgi:hypothetical protein
MNCVLIVWSLSICSTVITFIAPAFADLEQYKQPAKFPFGALVNDLMRGSKLVASLLLH